MTDRLNVGISRSSYLKTFDRYLKYKLFRQPESGKMPGSLSVLGTVTNYTQSIVGKEYLNTRYRTAYTGQFLIPRKISSRLSLELTPTCLHSNLLPTVHSKHDPF